MGGMIEALTAGLRGLAVCCVALPMAALPALAQSPAPTSGDVGQQQIRGAQDRGEALTAPNLVPSLSIPPQFGDAPPSPAQSLLAFPVSRIEVVGSTVYDAAAFAPLLASSIGRPNTLGELRALAAAVAEKYRRDGYPFTTVRLPGQQVIDGRVVLRVQEFRVTAVAFDLDGQAVAPPPALAGAVAAVLAERPVRQATLEAAQAQATRMVDLRIATTRFDRTRDDGVRLTLFLTRAGTEAVAIQPASLTGAPADQRIAVRGVRIVGNTALSAGDLTAEAAPVIGREASLAELNAVAQRIAGRYASAGYFGTSASLPPQVVRDGIVTIEVAELAIARVAVTLNGRPLPPDDLLSRAANAVTADQPATVAGVQRQLYVLNNIPGTFVESVIPPVVDDPNAEIYLRRAPITLTTALDNRGSSVGGPLEVGALITTNGILGLNEQIQLQALNSIPFDRVTFLGGLLIVPLTSDGLVGTLNASHSEATPGGYLAPIGVQALGDMFSAGLTYPVIARADLVSLLTFNLDAFNNSSSIFNGARTTSDERSRAVRLGTTTTIADGLGGRSIVRLVFSTGIDGFGSRPNGDQVNTRPGIRLDASKVLLDVNRTQPLPNGLQLNLGLLAQRASAVLPSAEVMTFGGVNYGRAYDSGIISGDHGIAAKVSLSRPTPTGNGIVPLVDPYVFYDVGETYQFRKTAGRSSSSSAASAGVGFRFVTRFGIGGSAELDFPLTRGGTLEPGRTNDRSPRVFFLLFAQY